MRLRHHWVRGEVGNSPVRSYIEDEVGVGGNVGLVGYGLVVVEVKPSVHAC